MLSLDYVVDRRLNDIIYALEVFGGGSLPNTAKAVSQAADAVIGIWSNAARGEFRHTSGKYINAIEKGKIYPYNDDRFQSAVINRLPYAGYIEHGFSGSYDLKNMLETSSKVRISKKGKRYLIIPFRHGIPGTRELTAMPAEVYKAAKEINPSFRTGKYTEPSQQGARTYKEAQMFLQQGHPQGKKVERFSYKWGGRLTREAMANIIQKQPDIKTSRYEGMVRFPRDTGTTGTQYLTFRVMHEDSKGWIRPPRAGLHIAERARQMSIMEVNFIISKGFEADKKMFMSMYQ